jgi:hypothetical protein
MPLPPVIGADRKIRNFASRYADTPAFLDGLPASGQRIVRVAHYASRRDITVILDEHVASVERLNQLANEYACSNSFENLSVEGIQRGEACVVIWSQLNGGDGKYYRAQYVRMNENGLSRIHFVDFGNSVDVGEKCLLHMPADLCIDPPYGISCKLAMRANQEHYRPLSDTEENQLTAVFNKAIDDRKAHTAAFGDPEPETDDTTRLNGVVSRFPIELTEGTGLNSSYVYLDADID